MKTILHLSDFHLLNNNVTYISKTKERFSKLFLAIKKSNLVPDVIVISGDIVNEGNFKMLGLFSEIITDVLSCFSLSLDRIVLTAGNHDLNFPKTGHLVEIKRLPNGECNVRNDLAFESVSNDSAYLIPFKEYIKFVKKINIKPDSPNDVKALSYCKNVAGMNFMVINSCWAERSYDQGVDKACIACNQVKFMINEYLQSKKNEINIAVLHHPHTKICEHCLYYYEQETVLENLYSITDLVLCGDIHATCTPKQMRTKGAYECIVGNGKIGENTTFAIYRIQNWGQELQCHYFTLKNDKWVLDSPQNRMKLRPKFYTTRGNYNRDMIVQYKAYHGTKEETSINLKLFFIRLYKIILDADDDFCYVKKKNIKEYDSVCDHHAEIALTQATYDIKGDIIETVFNDESQSRFWQQVNKALDFLLSKGLLSRENNELRITQKGISRFDLEIKSK